MSSITFRVDDAAENVAYSKGWVKSGSSFEYQSTTHGAAEEGANASFTFTGTSVYVFGTLGSLSAQKTVQSTYSIDGGPPAPRVHQLQDHIQYGVLLFRLRNLPLSTHTLVITSKTPLLLFWLDYFAVKIADAVATPSITREVTLLPSSSAPAQASTVVMTSVVNPQPASTGVATSTVTTLLPTAPPPPPIGSVQIDDQDSVVLYHGIWFIGGESQEYGHTIHGTEDSQATATLAFTGNGIAVYGTIPETPSGATRTSTYTLDGGNPVTFTSTSTSTTQYQRLLFQVQLLQDGQHTLVVTSGDGQAPFLLDYFSINSSSAFASPSSYENITTIPALLPSATSTISPPSLSSASSSSGNKGAIAGGVLGGVLFIILLVAFIVYQRRRKPPPRYVASNPEPGWTPSTTWTNEKLTMRRNGNL